MIQLFELPTCPHCAEVKKLVKCDQVIQATTHYVEKYSLTEVPTIIIFDNDRIVYYLVGIDEIKRFFSKGIQGGVPPST